jgi:hypothetical protein
MNTETNTAATKILTPSDKIALRVVEKIRDDRSSWEQSEHLDETSKTITFGSVIGTAKIAVIRKEVAGKKSKESIARASIVVTPESGKALTITGHLAARAWFALTHAPKGRTAKEVDLEAIAAAEAALGL